MYVSHRRIFVDTLHRHIIWQRWWGIGGLPGSSHVDVDIDVYHTKPTSKQWPTANCQQLRIVSGRTRRGLYGPAGFSWLAQQWPVGRSYCTVNSIRWLYCTSTVFQDDADGVWFSRGSFGVKLLKLCKRFAGQSFVSRERRPLLVVPITASKGL